MTRPWFLFILIFFIVIPVATHGDMTVPIDLLLLESEFYDGTAWETATIKRFLDGLPGGMKAQLFRDVDEQMHTPAEIIANAARTYGVNPKVLLATLQKEQSLLEDPNPSQDQLDWAMGYGVCDDCRHDDPGIQKFRGFTAQMNRAAERFRYYREHPKEFTFQVGKASIVDGITVTPQNIATAALFNYTPHLAGNIRFLELWRKYFGREYTEGSLLQAPGDKTVWYIQYGTRRAITSPSILYSRFDPRTVIRVHRFELDQYAEGTPIRFPQFAILRSLNRKLFLLQNDIRRSIASIKILRRFGFSEAEIIDVTDNDLALYAEGKPLTARDLYPIGALIEDKKTKDVYYVENGVKRRLLDPWLSRVLFPGRPVLKGKESTLADFTLGETMTLADGTLLKSSKKKETAVYILDQGTRRPFASEDVFRDRGYKWNNVRTVPERVLALHPMGARIEF